MAEGEFEIGGMPKLPGDKFYDIRCGEGAHRFESGGFAVLKGECADKDVRGGGMGDEETIS